MNENQKKVDISYFYISKEHNKVLSSLIDNGVLGTKEDGIKLGVALGLAFNPSGSLDEKQQSQLSRSSEGLNYNSADFDEDQLITHKIGDDYRSTKLDGGLSRGGAALQIERSVEDTKRIGKFLFSGKGALFTLKQSVLVSR